MLAFQVMNCVHLCWVRAVLAGSVATTALACRHEPSPAARAHADGGLDGMELSAATRVGLESATDAMERRDLKRLKMLSVWVRGRAQVVLFTPDDLRSLDLAITCLEGGLSRSERTAAFDEIKTGQLSKAARSLCLDDEE